MTSNHQVRVWLDDYAAMLENLKEADPVWKGMVASRARKVREWLESPSETPAERWLVWYADPDRTTEHFSGVGAEEAARHRWQEQRQLWTCWLFRSEGSAEKAAEPLAHKWDADGERCTVCGDKDWMGTTCSGLPSKTNKCLCTPLAQQHLTSFGTIAVTVHPDCPLHASPREASLVSRLQGWVNGFDQHESPSTWVARQLMAEAITALSEVSANGD